MQLHVNRRTCLVAGVAVILAVVVVLWTLQPHTTWELVGVQRSAKRPSLLRHMFVCVTFAWQPHKIVYLKQIAQRTANYPTRVDLCIVTDEPARVQALFDSWALPHTRVCGTYNQLNASEQYALVWEHRAAFEKAYREGDHSLFMYIEDDTDVTWPALLSWAADTKVLEPLGFLRHFWRTEISNFTGNPVFLDFYTTINLTSWNRTLHLSNQQLPRACSVVNQEALYWRWREQPGCAHRHYLQLPSPYYGMWTATRAQLARFMQSDWWDKAGALAAEIEMADYQQEDYEKRQFARVMGKWPWGYPERSTGMIQLLDVPNGFWSRGVVPYDPQLKRLLPLGRVGHERNAYTGNVARQLDVRALFLPDGANVTNT